MKITDLLKISSIRLNGSAKTKAEIIKEMTDLMESAGVLSDAEAYEQAVFVREAEGSTGMGEMVAIPHAKSAAVKTPALAAMVLAEGVDYDSLDGLPVRLVFMIAAPEGGENVHLEVLSRLSVLLMDENFCKELMAAQSPEQFLAVIDSAERAQLAAEESPAEAAENIRVAAVTACPTGIAHTYMAAESLERYAQELGISVKVETDGSGGVKNALTGGEIAEAEAVIIAVDREVEMERFAGKRVVFASTAEAIHTPEKLFERAFDASTEIYRGGGNAASKAADGA
ncbi:MAG: fructose PTS transporter subunit IIA [Synergistaceae bacterium]|nr:fructose PTS transporter subunit IIA [Synergistaceae bacterium]